MLHTNARHPDEQFSVQISALLPDRSWSEEPARASDTAAPGAVSERLRPGLWAALDEVRSWGSAGKNCGAAGKFNSTLVN